MKPIFFHSRAKAELDEAVAYYERQKAGLGLDLLSAVEHAVRQIRRNPAFGALYKSTKYRHFLIRRFPYVVFYVELEDAIWILAVAHGKRRPDYWRRRRGE